MIRTQLLLPILAAIGLCAIFAVALPHAAVALDHQGDSECTKVYPQCPPCGPTPPIVNGKCTGPGPNQFMCPGLCHDVTNDHTTTGQCTAMQKCQALSSEGKGMDKGLAQLGKMLGDIMSKLMQPKSGGDSPPPPPSTSPLNQGCMSGYFQTSDISQIGVNPCAQYVQPLNTGSLDLGLGNSTSTGCDPVSSLLGTCNAGSDNGGGNNSGGDVFGDTGGGTSSTSTVKTPRTLYPSVPTAGNNFFLTGTGTRGDILILGGGATVIAGARDNASNTEVAGFLGGGTIGQPQSLVAKWCQDRPWATNFLSAIIPPTFFDGLCSARGYQVGQSSGPSAPVVETTPHPRPQSTTTPDATTPAVKAKAEIWATPPSVALGGRTSVFWNSQGVTACTESSADGNFNQNSLSGGAATVALTGDTTFTISCTALDGSTVTKSVTVGLKI